MRRSALIAGLFALSLGSVPAFAFQEMPEPPPADMPAAAPQAEALQLGTPGGADLRARRRAFAASCDTNRPRRERSAMAGLELHYAARDIESRVFAAIEIMSSTMPGLGKRLSLSSRDSSMTSPSRSSASYSGSQ